MSAREVVANILDSLIDAAAAHHDMYPDDYADRILQALEGFGFVKYVSLTSHEAAVVQMHEANKRQNLEEKCDALQRKLDHIAEAGKMASVYADKANAAIISAAAIEAAKGE